MHISSSSISLTNARTFSVPPHRRSLAYRLQRAETAYGIVQPDAGAIRGRTAAISDREGWYFLNLELDQGWGEAHWSILAIIAYLSPTPISSNIDFICSSVIQFFSRRISPRRLCGLCVTLYSICSASARWT